MNVFKHLLLISFLTFWAFNNAYKADAQEHDHSCVANFEIISKKQFIGGCSDILEDPTQLLTLQDIFGPHQQTRFIHAKNSFLTFGYPESVYWVRLNINNASPKLVLAFLEVTYPLFERIDLFQVFKDAQIKSQTVGNEVPYSQRKVASISFVFPLELQNGVSSVYIRFKSSGFMNIPLVLWNESQFHSSVKKDYLVFGTYLGIIVALITMSTIFYLKTRQKGYLWLSILAINYFLWLGTILGFVIEFCFQDLTVQIKYIFLVICFCVSFFELQFLKHFLIQERGSRFAHFLVGVFLAFPVVGVFLIPFVRYKLLIQAAAIFAIVSFILEIGMGLFFAAKRYKPAYFYLCAKIVMQITATSNILISFKLFPYSLNVPWNMLFGSGFECVLFLIAMMNKVRLSESDLLRFEILKKEHQIAHEKIDIYAQVAHDIRSPLVALNFTKAHLGPLDEEIRILLRSAIDRVNDIVSSILVKKDILQSIGTPLNNEKKQTKDVLFASLLDLLVAEKRAEYSGVKDLDFPFHVDASAYGLFVNVCPTELKRALSNLINNSVESILGPGKVSLSLKESRNFAELRISDTGKGMPKDHLQKLGTKGFTFGKRNGSGLGIFAAKAIIEASGGSIRFESKEGTGTTLSILLPQKTCPSWYVPHLEVKKRQTIVILDDDETIHKIWDKRFAPFSSNLDLSVLHFYSPEQLQNWFHSTSPQVERGDYLFLVDFDLGSQNKIGLALIQELNIVEHSIVVSSHFYEEIEQAKDKTVIIRFLPKNLSPIVPIKAPQFKGLVTSVFCFALLFCAVLPKSTLGNSLDPTSSSGSRKILDSNFPSNCVSKAYA